MLVLLRVGLLFDDVSVLDFGLFTCGCVVVFVISVTKDAGGYLLGCFMIEFWVLFGFYLI